MAMDFGSVKIFASLKEKIDPIFDGLSSTAIGGSIACLTA